MSKLRIKDPLLSIPNIGPSIAADLRRIGITEPSQLAGKDGYELYRQACATDGVRHDPCLVDVFLSAVHYVETGENRKWWEFTDTRKRNRNRWEVSETPLK